MPAYYPPDFPPTDEPPPDTLEDRAVRIYRMIEGVGWNISKRGPVPDDGWPIDIIKREIEAIVGEHGRWLAELMAEIKIRDDTITFFQGRVCGLEDRIADLEMAVESSDYVIDRLNQRLALFEAEIVRLGEQGNSCTYDVLDKICAGCKCGRANHELPG
jgi:uncharacterized coiled-coil protein SlyX